MKAGVFHELNIGDTRGQKTANKSLDIVKKLPKLVKETGKKNSFYRKFRAA